MASYIIQESTLNSIGSAIRNKTGKSDLLSPAEMITEINSLKNNEVVPITITTNGTYTPIAGVDGYSSVVVDVPYYVEEAIPVPCDVFEEFYEEGWESDPYIWRYNIRNWAETGTVQGNNIRDWVFDNFRHEIREHALPLGRSGPNVCERFCYNNTHIDGLEIRVGKVENYKSMFEGCTNLVHFEFYKDSIAVYTICYLNNMFKDCHNYRIFNDYRTYPDVENPYEPGQGYPAPNQFERFVGGVDIEGIFNGCYSLKRLPNWGRMSTADGTVEWNGIERGEIVGTYIDSFKYCHTLDSIQELPPTSLIADYTKSIFYNAFFECFRLDRMTFLKHKQTKQPLVADWSGQTIDLSKYVGYGYEKEYDGKNAITGFNSQLHQGDLIYDEASYALGKTMPLRNYTYNVGYSRYNKTSAIETIDSLPDTSAAVAGTGRTNTIKFTGIAGEFTDGGAINTLSDETIAAAAAKGWTVVYV